jgi:D-tyrosyl-tRNA(Tyr) deacylase
MRALIQRVLEAEVEVQGRVISRIGPGLCVFVCVMKGDTREDIKYIARKIATMRLFEQDRKMNLSVQDVAGEVLVVSQFTLSARTRKGTRPSFDDAEKPPRAEEMYKEFIRELIGLGVKTKEGAFGQYMQIRLVNDGPVTIWIDSKVKGPK